MSGRERLSNRGKERIESRRQRDKTKYTELKVIKLTKEYGGQQKKDRGRGCVGYQSEYRCVCVCVSLCRRK